MATEYFYLEEASGKSGTFYIRIFDTAGNVFDFNDNTFKALGSATTPYKRPTERTDVSGTGRSGYFTDVNLSNVNANLDARAYVVQWYDNATPASGDNPVSGAPKENLFVQLGERVDRAEMVDVRMHMSVNSTAGNEAHVSLWALFRGKLVSLSGATCSLTVKEAGGTVALFTLTQTDKLGSNAINDNRFELKKATPGFTADRQYRLSGTITINSVSVTGEHCQTVIG